MPSHIHYVCAQLGKAVDQIRDTDAPMRNRLLTAFHLGSLFPADWIEDDAAREEYVSIVDELSRNESQIAGEGRLSATLFTMSDAEVDEVARRIVSLADYLCDKE